MKTLKSISTRICPAMARKRFLLPALLCVSGITAYAQGYYDDDLYYDASKAKKEAPKPAQSAQAQSNQAYGTQYTTTPQQTAPMYYYDGAAYVPWDSVGDYRPADSYILSGSGSTRDVDEYNRRGPAYEAAHSSSMPDSISLQDFETMSATEYLARFGDSQVARETLASASLDTDYADVYNAGYNSGYDAGFNASPSTSLSINFGAGYPYGYYPYYSSWGWPYYSWRYPYYWNSPSWAWGWDYPAWSWGWNWGWTSPSWAWGWGYPGFYPGYYPGYWGGSYRPSPSAAHRPRSTGYNHGAAGSRGGRYDHATPGSSARPGYRPPSTGGTIPSGNGGYYGGSSSGRNSHFGTGSNAGYRPSGGSATGSGQNSHARPAGTSNSNRNGNFGASQSTRNGSYNNSNYNSNRSGSYNSNRSSGGFSGGGRSGGYSGGGGRSGGGGHRSR